MNVRRANVRPGVYPLGECLSQIAVPSFETICFPHALRVLRGAVASGELGDDARDPGLDLAQGDRRRRPRDRRHGRQEALLVAAGLRRSARSCRGWQPQPVVRTGYAVCVAGVGRAYPTATPRQVVSARLLRACEESFGVLLQKYDRLPVVPLRVPGRGDGRQGVLGLLACVGSWPASPIAGRTNESKLRRFWRGSSPVAGPRRPRKRPAGKTRWHESNRLEPTAILRRAEAWDPMSQPAEAEGAGLALPWSP